MSTIFLISGKWCVYTRIRQNAGIPMFPIPCVFEKDKNSKLLYYTTIISVINKNI